MTVEFPLFRAWRFAFLGVSVSSRRMNHNRSIAGTQASFHPILTHHLSRRFSPMITSAKALLKVVPALFCLAFSIESFAADIQLAWDPNPEANLAGYKVYYGLAPGNYGVAINLGNQTTYTVTGLAVGTYYFVVTAYNTLGLESDASNEVSATIGVSATLSLGATPGSGNVTVSWSGVTNPTLTDWIGRYSTGGGDGSYGEWKYSSSCALSPGSSPRSSGSCILALPTVAGTYEYRLFASGSYVRLGTSSIITVSGEQAPH
jgi:hypothetical protein